MKNQTLLGLLNLTALLAVGTTAHAEYCLDDIDCKGEQVCDFSGGLSCFDSECGGVQEDCRCDSPDPGVCAAPPCNANADCPGGMQCVPTSSADCGVAPCAEGQTCDSEPGCLELMQHQECVFPWEAECQSDADCGDADQFTCVTQQECICPAKQDAGAASSATATTSANMACDCAASNVCEPKPMDCTEDAACPSDWTCVGSLMQAACPAGSPSGEDSGKCKTTIIKGSCQPPSSQPVHEYAGEQPPRADFGNADRPDAGRPDLVDNDSPNTASDKKPEDNKDETDNKSVDSSGSGDSDEGGGCNIRTVAAASHAPNAPGQGAVWALLGLLGLALQRRKS